MSAGAEVSRSGARKQSQREKSLPQMSTLHTASRDRYLSQALADPVLHDLAAEFTGLSDSEIRDRIPLLLDEDHGTPVELWVAGLWPLLTPETMTVTVRDRSAEAPWGSGPTNPVTRTVTISAYCAICGGRRGEPRGLNQCEDSVHYWVQVWDNPCGHVDSYVAVLKEAEAR